LVQFPDCSIFICKIAQYFFGGRGEGNHDISSTSICHPYRIDVFLDKALYNDHLCLVALNKQPNNGEEVKKSTEKLEIGNS